MMVTSFSPIMMVMVRVVVVRRRSGGVMRGGS
jgi:hypothetical protein